MDVELMDEPMDEPAEASNFARLFVNPKRIAQLRKHSHRNGGVYTLDFGCSFLPRFRQLVTTHGCPNLHIRRTG